MMKMNVRVKQQTLSLRLHILFKYCNHAIQQQQQQRLKTRVSKLQGVLLLFLLF